MDFNKDKFRITKSNSDLTLLYKTTGSGGSDKNIEGKARRILRELGLSVGPIKIITKSVPDALLGRCNIVTFENLDVTLSSVVSVLENDTLDDKTVRQFLLLLLRK